MKQSHTDNSSQATEMEVVTSYPDRFAAYSAIDALKRAGIPAKDIHLMSSPTHEPHPKRRYLPAIAVGAVMAGAVGLLLALILSSQSVPWVTVGSAIVGAIGSVLIVAFGGPNIAVPSPEFTITPTTVTISVSVDQTSETRRVAEAIMRRELEESGISVYPPLRSAS